MGSVTSQILSGGSNPVHMSMTGGNLDGDVRVYVQQLLMTNLPALVNNSVKDAFKSQSNEIQALRAEVCSLRETVDHLRGEMERPLSHPYIAGSSPYVIEDHGHAHHREVVSPSSSRHDDSKKFKDQCREAAKVYLDLSKPWSAQDPQARKNATKMVMEHCNATEEEISARFKKYLTHIKSYSKRTSRRRSQIDTGVESDLQPMAELAVGMKRKVEENLLPQAKRMCMQPDRGEFAPPPLPPQPEKMQKVGELGKDGMDDGHSSGMKQDMMG